MKRAAPLPALPDHDAATAALVFATDPWQAGGVVLRGRPGPGRDDWLDLLRRILPEDTPVRRVPVNVSSDRLLGGLDFAATIAAGRPVFTSGLLEGADGGILIQSMAERLPPEPAALMGNALDSGVVRIEREGRSGQRPARFGLVALDEGLDADERLREGLCDRMAFCIDTNALEPAQTRAAGWGPRAIEAARARLGAVRVSGHIVDALCRGALAFGIASVRADLISVRVARMVAALSGRSEVGQADAAIAARLVYPQRATRLPVEPPPEAHAAERQPPDQDNETSADRAGEALADQDMIVEAVRAVLPPGLLASLAPADRRRGGSKQAGGRAAGRVEARRGRPIGVTGMRAPGRARLNVLATLKAAAPWQRLRRGEADGGRGRFAIARDDLRVTRFRDRVETTTLFVVDASGSQAARRLGEVKGAIELLLHDCYVRRDQVALIAFRGSAADVLLPPTRALARARRSLAALPGGGATPLAAGIDAARDMADTVTRQGRTPAIVLMTDGRANVARNGEHDPAVAEHDALGAGRLLRAEGIRAMLVDTSRRPRPRARALAEAMGADYVPLPRADAATISATVQAGVR